MKWSVIIRPRAEADVRAARDWYETQRAGLGNSFLIEVGHAIELLTEQPERRPIYYRGLRRLITRRKYSNCWRATAWWCSASCTPSAITRAT